MLCQAVHNTTETQLAISYAIAFKERYELVAICLHYMFNDDTDLLVKNNEKIMKSLIGHANIISNKGLV